MKITKFCYIHSACAEGLEWAIGTGLTTMAELWLREDMRPEWREWIATRPGVLDDRELRLYGCWCVRRLWHLLPDERSRKAVEVAERFSDGKATEEELASANAAAWSAANDAASAAASAACASRSEWAAAWASAGAAASSACDASPAARASARASARAAQSSYLLETVHPSFDARKAAGV